MANYSTAELNVSAEADLFSTMSKSDDSSVHEETYSWRYLARTYFNNSKQLRSSKSNISLKQTASHDYYKNLPGAMPISMNQMFKAQNTNAPWLFNILKKKFHRSRKHKEDRRVSDDSMTQAEEFLEKPTSHDGTSGKWIASEKDVTFPLIKDFQTSTSGQYNISRAMSSSTSPITLSTDESLHLRHYHYDFQTPVELSASSLIDDQPPTSSPFDEETKQIPVNHQDVPVDFTSVASIVKAYYATSRQQINSVKTEETGMPSVSPSSPPTSTLEPITEDVYLVRGNSTTQTAFKRAKSASASRSRRGVSSSSTKKGKGQGESTKKKRSKYYQEHLLSPEEIELREALRIIDLDNIGFFPPTELRKVLKEIGIQTNDIEKIERCLPLDEDGHYSIDNLIRLFLGSK